MSESAPRDNTDTPSGCGDMHCDNGEIKVHEQFVRDRSGKQNPFARGNKAFIKNTCLLCAIVAAGGGVHIAIS